MEQPAWQLIAAVVWLLIVNVAGAWDVWQDKRVAGSQARRVPEAQLIRWAFLGGWPLMALTMQRVRHKTRKGPFLRQFWMAAFWNCVLVAVLVVLLVVRPFS